MRGAIEDVVVVAGPAVLYERVHRCDFIYYFYIFIDVNACQCLLIIT